MSRIDRDTVNRATSLVKWAGNVFVTQPKIPLVPSEVFVEGESKKFPGLRFARIPEEFKEAFFVKSPTEIPLDLGQRKPGSSAILRLYDLSTDTIDEKIVEHLGGLGQIDTTLDDLLSQIVKNPNASDYALVRQRKVDNLFYIRSLSGSLVTVSVSLNQDGWTLRVNDLGRYAYCRVFTYYNIEDRRPERKCLVAKKQQEAPSVISPSTVNKPAAPRVSTRTKRPSPWA